jgi:hypothetical protein
MGTFIHPPIPVVVFIAVLAAKRFAIAITGRWQDSGMYSFITFTQLTRPQLSSADAEIGSPMVAQSLSLLSPFQPPSIPLIPCCPDTNRHHWRTPMPSSLCDTAELVACNITHQSHSNHSHFGPPSCHVQQPPPEASRADCPVSALADVIQMSAWIT